MPTPDSPLATSTLIIGAGIAGLAAGVRLKKTGEDFLVLEGSPRVGGAINTTVLHTEAGEWRLETGPNTVQLSTPAVQELLEAAGLADKIEMPNPAAKNRYIVRNGRLHKLPSGPLSLLRSGLVGWGSKWKIITETRRPLPTITADTSVADLLAQRFGQEVVDYIADPFLAGVYAGSPQGLSALHALPAFVKLMQENGSLLKGQRAAARARRAQGLPPMPPIFSVPGGLERWMQALAAHLGPALRTHTPITHLAPDATGGWRATLGDGSTVAARRVIHTLPADGLMATLQGTDLEGPLHTALHDLPHPPVAMLSLGFRREDVAHPLDGFGVLVPSRERQFSMLGALFPSSLFPGRAPAGHVLMAVFVGGSRAPHLAHLPQDEMQTRIMRDLHTLLGVRAAPVLSHLRVWPRAIPQYDLHHGARLAALAALQTQYPTLVLAGNYHGGIGVPARAGVMG